MKQEIQDVLKEMAGMNGIPESCYNLLFAVIHMEYGAMQAMNLGRMTNATDGMFYLREGILVSDVLRVIDS